MKAALLEQMKRTHAALGEAIRQAEEGMRAGGIRPWVGEGDPEGYAHPSASAPKSETVSMRGPAAPPSFEFVEEIGQAAGARLARELSAGDPP